MQKVYYDATANKEVVDISGKKDEAAVKAEFSLGAATQVLEIDESFEATEVLAGTLTKFNHKERLTSNKVSKKTDKEARKSAIKAKLGLSDSDLEDLKVALS